MGPFFQALHKEGLHNSYFTPSIIQLIISRRMSWMGNVALIRGDRNTYRVLLGKETTWKA